jgi:hypothetical protein
MSNRPQWGAYDKGSCTEEPCETERLTHGSESEVRTERFLPTVTGCPESCRPLTGVSSANICWSRPGKPGEIVGRVRGRLAVPAAELLRYAPTQVRKFYERKEVSFS